MLTAASLLEAAALLPECPGSRTAGVLNIENINLPAAFAGRAPTKTRRRAPEVRAIAIREGIVLWLKGR